MLGTTMYYFIVLGLFAFMQRTSATDIRPRVSEAEVEQFVDHRYLVYLEGYKQESVVGYKYCSGSILSERWIISAAQCFKEGFASVKVLQGHLFFFTKTIAEVAGSSITVHPEFHADKPSNEHDLALLNTVEDILFGFFTKPIMLAATAPKAGQEAIVAVYGYSEYGPWIPQISTAELTQCIKNDTNVLCTYRDVHDSNPDSGGALVANDGLIGVISDGFCELHDKNITECETRYVDVTKHLKWIQDVLSIK